MTENDLFDKNEIALIQSFLGNYISQNQDNVNSKELNDTPVLAHRSTCRRNEKKWKKIIKGVEVMRATKKNKKDLLNEYLRDIFAALSHISPKNILPPEDFVNLPMPTMKHVYEKQLTIFKWIGHDLEVLYNLVNDKDFEPFDGNKYFQTWLKLRENERSKKKKLSDFLKED